MSSKVLKNCRKAILNLIKSINTSELPFSMDELLECGTQSISVWYHKDYPYSYQRNISKVSLILNDETKIFVYQYMDDIDVIRIEIEIVFNGLPYKIDMSKLNQDKIHSYNRAIKQTYDQRDFWQEVEL